MIEKGKIEFENESDRFIPKPDGRARGLNNKGFPLKKIIEKTDKVHVLECGHSLYPVGAHNPRSRRCPICAGNVLQLCSNCERLEQELSELRAQLQKDWTPISEGLPEASGYYLVTYEAPEKSVTMLWFENGEWLTPENNILIINDVTAYRPLPPAYEGEGK